LIRLTLGRFTIDNDQTADNERCRKRRLSDIDVTVSLIAPNLIDPCPSRPALRDSRRCPGAGRAAGSLLQRGRLGIGEGACHRHLGAWIMPVNFYLNIFALQEKKRSKNDGDAMDARHIALVQQTFEQMSR
jgi:hypothetical protein